MTRWIAAGLLLTALTVFEARPIPSVVAIYGIEHVGLLMASHLKNYSKHWCRWMF